MNGMPSPINARRFIYEAVAHRGFQLANDGLPEAELDGEPIDFEAVIYATLVRLGDGSPFALPDSVSSEDYDRAWAVVDEVEA